MPPPTLRSVTRTEPRGSVTARPRARSRGVKVIASVALALLLALALGCGEESEPAPELQALDGPIELAVSDGFGFSETSVEIDADGSAVALDGRERRIGFELDADELDTVAVTAAASFADGSRKLPPRCLDCPIYEITYEGERIVLDQASLDRSIDERRLVGALERGVPGGLNPRGRDVARVDP